MQPKTKKKTNSKIKSNKLTTEQKFHEILTGKMVYDLFWDVVHHDLNIVGKNTSSPLPGQDSVVALE